MIEFAFFTFNACVGGVYDHIYMYIVFPQATKINSTQPSRLHYSFVFFSTYLYLDQSRTYHFFFHTGLICFLFLVM